MKTPCRKAVRGFLLGLKRREQKTQKVPGGIERKDKEGKRPQRHEDVKETGTIE